MSTILIVEDNDKNMKLARDVLQAKGYAVPETFTHGTAEQRVRWFRTGFETGSLTACNTFEARRL